MVLSVPHTFLPLSHFRVSEDLFKEVTLTYCDIVAAITIDTLRATFCNHQESPDNFNFFESLIISAKIPFDELFLKTMLKTWSDIYFFENFRKIDRAPEVPIFECKLCTKAQHLQKSPIRLRLLTKPSLSFIYMCDMIRYPYLNKWPFLTAF